MTASASDASEVRILVVEDDDGVRRLMRALFEDGGYQVSEARNSRQALEALARERIALVTLDLGLSGEDGLSLARDIRRSGDVPIIIVTAKASEVDRIVGLELGADDYIVKPFNTRETLARVRAVLRRTSPRAPGDDRPARFAFADFEFDVSTRSLSRRDGHYVALTTRELALLEVFVRRPRRALSRDALLDLVGGDSGDTLDRAIDTLVSRLRRKLGDDSERPQLIKTVRGAGYVFAASVSPL